MAGNQSSPLPPLPSPPPPAPPPAVAVAASVARASAMALDETPVTGAPDKDFETLLREQLAKEERGGVGGGSKHARAPKSARRAPQDLHNCAVPNV